jgi:hypothetical protein
MTQIAAPAAKQSYEDWHARYAVDAEAATPWHRLVKAHLSNSADLAGKRVLEIGWGRGRFACWLASQRPEPMHIVAADFSPLRSKRDASSRFSVPFLRSSGKLWTSRQLPTQMKASTQLSLVRRLSMFQIPRKQCGN